MFSFAFECIKRVLFWEGEELSKRAAPFNECGSDEDLLKTNYGKSRVVNLILNQNTLEVAERDKLLHDVEEKLFENQQERDYLIKAILDKDTVIANKYEYHQYTKNRLIDELQKHDDATVRIALKSMLLLKDGDQVNRGLVDYNLWNCIEHYLMATGNYLSIKIFDDNSARLELARDLYIARLAQIAKLGVDKTREDLVVGRESDQYELFKDKWEKGVILNLILKADDIALLKETVLQGEENEVGARI